MKRCCKCLVHFQPGKNRSYHLLPKDVETRRKWIDILELPRDFLTKQAYVCSAHFDQDSFIDHFEEKSKRRLKFGSLPSKTLLDNSFIDGVCSAKKELEDSPITITENEAHLKNKCNSTCSMDDLIPSVLDESINAANKNGSLVQSVPEPKKRKQLDETQEEIKRIKFMNSNKVEYISRNDFVSSEAWNKFLTFKRIQELKFAALKNRQSRQNRKINSFVALFKYIKGKKATDAASYL